MIRPNPKSTLFPYTTLFRSRSSPARAAASDAASRLRSATRDSRSTRPVVRSNRRTFLPRSEEHTSELQSLRHLVCRLLLEKKKQQLVILVERWGRRQRPIEL